MSKQFKTGDRVKYAVSFLRSCGLILGDYGFMRGVVESVHPIGSNRWVVKVLWDSQWNPDNDVKGVLNVNLAHEKALEVD